MKSILDPTFRYIPSAQTDIRKTFARLRREQRARVARVESEEPRHDVLTLFPRRAVPAGSR
jgi:hypothetical protein